MPWHRILLLLTALVALTVAQSNSCAQVRTQSTVLADVGYACLKSVPFKRPPALATIETFKRFTQFHSTTSLLKNPPAGYENPPVDLLALLDQTAARVNAGVFTNQYDFEVELWNITSKAYDGHYQFRGNTFSGALQWMRGSGTSASLISVSPNGTALPQVYLFSDLKDWLGAARYTPSPVTAINRVPVLEFIRQESQYQPLHDADARFNVMFYRAVSQSIGRFVTPPFYPGPDTTFTFGNGSSKTVNNVASIPTGVSWTGVNDGSTFYTKFVDPSNSQENPKAALMRRLVPSGYPTSVIQHSSKDVILAGFFLSGTGFSDVAVLTIGTFNSGSSSNDKFEFQNVVTQFLALCKSQNKKKIIVDIRSNNGGSVLLGYDTFKQFFPKIEPDLASNMRAHEGLNILGSEFGLINSYNKANNSELCNGCYSANQIYLNSIHYKQNLDSNLQSFKSWQDMYGPVSLKGDQFTKMLRYNFSDPLLESPFTVTGYGSRSGAAQPFDPANVVLLHDGSCSSTCAFFSDLMRRQGGAKSYAIGGRPQNGPMQPVGGTRGSLLLEWTTLRVDVLTVFYGFGSRSDQEKWDAILPDTFGIQTSTPPGVNFRNAYHPGGDTALQFINEKANCRMFYTPEMAFNVTFVWQAVAAAAWNGVDVCVAGSKTGGDSSEIIPNSATGTARSPSSTASAGGGGSSAGSRIRPGGIWVTIIVVIVALIVLYT